MTIYQVVIMTLTKVESAYIVWGFPPIIIIFIQH